MIDCAKSFSFQDGSRLPARGNKREMVAKGQGAFDQIKTDPRNRTVATRLKVRCLISAEIYTDIFVAIFGWLPWVGDGE